MLKTLKILMIIALVFISGCIFDKNDEKQKNLNTQIIQPNNSIIATINTSVGDIEIKLFKEKVPQTVDNFIKLAQDDFYNNQKFHKVIIDFIIQTGDPVTKGIHNEDFVYQDENNPNELPNAGAINIDSTLEKEFSDLQFNKAGLVAMVDDSQFFITLASTPWLNDKYTIFGEVIEGLEIAKKIERGDWINNITINYPILKNN
jgi:cyclophilin family peptidyl-prolyl cis-trans isomerase